MSDEVTTEVDSTVLLKINSVDFTARVVQKNYSVQKQDEYSSWIDGNWKQRRAIARTRISGTFKMSFQTQNQFSAFISAVAAVKTNGGYCSGVQIWVGNTKSLETINAFLDYTAKPTWTTEAFGMEPELSAVTVKVTER